MDKPILGQGTLFVALYRNRLQANLENSPLLLTHKGKILIQTRRQVDNLYEDLRDGHNLIALLEVLSGETLVSNQCIIYIEVYHEPRKLRILR